jgi:hypothetical protein
MLLDKESIFQRLNNLVEEVKASFDVQFIDEVAMKRVVRGGKIVRKVKLKRKGFKVVRKGSQVRFVRMTQKEKRVRRVSARKAWRVGKSARKTKAKRTMVRSKVRMKTLYGK